MSVFVDGVIRPGEYFFKNIFFMALPSTLRLSVDLSTEYHDGVWGGNSSRWGLGKLVGGCPESNAPDVMYNSEVMANP